MALPPAKEGTAEIAARVAAARERQNRRFEGTDIICNAELSGKMFDMACALEEDARALMTRAAERYGLSARGYHRVLKVARTIADLAGIDNIARAHVAEALSYRGM